MKDTRVSFQKGNMILGGGGKAPALASSNRFSFLGDSQPYTNSANNTKQMPALPFLLFILLFLIPDTTSTRVCDSSESCGLRPPYIRFPFRLRDSNQSQRCGYPGFELSCDNGLTLLNIPSAGNFVVTSMSSVHAYIDDPDGCFPRRFLKNNISLDGTPFKWGDGYVLTNYTFLKCPDLRELYQLESVGCLSNIYNSDVVVLSNYWPYENEWISSCGLISSTWIPILSGSDWSFSNDIYSKIKLEWNEPNCTNCYANSENCGFLGDTGLDVTCYSYSTNFAQEDPSSEAALRRGLGISIALIILIVVVPCLYCGRSKSEMQREQPQAIIEFPNSNIPQTPVFAGLDRSIIETYPKIEVSESTTLPDPNDNICSICLCEYKPKDTLRCIPNCNHYFHLDCIDEWLKMNATCPMCRNLTGISLCFQHQNNWK